MSQSSEPNQQSQNSSQAQGYSEIAENIQILQSKLINMKIFIAVPMGILMILYFFSFASLIDMGHMGALYFELFSSIAFVFGFIYLNQLGFWLLKKRFSKHSIYGPILRKLDINSIAKDAQQIAEHFSV